MKQKKRSAYFKVGVTAFLVIAASLLFYFIIFHSSSFGRGVSVVIQVLNPIFYGFIIAYILNPQMQLIDNFILWLVSKTKRKPGRGLRRAIRTVSTFLALAIAVLIIYVLVSKMVPNIIESIQTVVENFHRYIENITAWMDRTFQNTGISTKINPIILKIADKTGEWFSASLTPAMDALMTSLSDSLASGALNLFRFFKNLILGIVVAIYVLINKDTIKARFFRMIYSLFPITKGNNLVATLRFVDEKFGGFLIGKMIDSAIIGLICYVCVSLMKMPYPLLLSVVVGVTNIIPVFGPFIGLVPTAFLVLAIAPGKALLYILFILLLQQLDGNFIGPKILGNSVGISSFLVLVSIIIFGGFFGITGMIFGVPLTAIAIAFMQTLLFHNLEKKQVPSELEPYRNLDHIDPTTRKNVLRSEKEKDRKKPSLYIRLKRRSDLCRRFDYPLRPNPWDKTAESVKAVDRAKKESMEAEKESYESDS